MRGKLFAIISALSLALFAATGFEWLRTYEYAHMTWFGQSGSAFRHAGIVWIVVRQPYINVYFPFWPPALILLLLPTLWAVWGFRRRWRSKECCTGCGYNLTGNISGVCPECGTKIVGEA